MTKVVSVENIILHGLSVLRHRLNVVRPDEPFLIAILGQLVLDVSVVVVHRQIELVRRRNVVIQQGAFIRDLPEFFDWVELLSHTASIRAVSVLSAFFFKLILVQRKLLFLGVDSLFFKAFLSLMDLATPSRA